MSLVDAEVRWLASPSPKKSPKKSPKRAVAQLEMVIRGADGTERRLLADTEEDAQAWFGHRDPPQFVPKDSRDSNMTFSTHPRVGGFH